MRTTKAGSFTAFLEARKKRQKSPAAALDLIKVLGQAEGQRLEVSELIEKSGMGFSNFSEALESMSKAGFIELTSGPDGEIALLTNKGRDLAGITTSG